MYEKEKKKANVQKVLGGTEKVTVGESVITRQNF